MSRSFKLLIWLIFFIAIAGCIQTSSEPDIIATQVVRAPTEDTTTTTTDDTALFSDGSEPESTEVAQASEMTPTATIEAPEQFSIVGTVQNGTTDQPLAEPLSINAVLVNNVDGQPTELYSETQTVGEDSAFRFEGIATEFGIINVRTEYDGVQQFSPFYLVPSDLQGDELIVDLVVYEVTDDKSAIELTNATLFADAVLEEEVSSILFVVQLVNSGDQIVWDGESSFEIPLPALAQNPQITVPPMMGINPDDLAILDESGERPVFRGVIPMIPGETGQIFFTVEYLLPYLGNIAIDQPFAHDVQQLQVYYPEAREFVFTSEQTASEPDLRREDINYVGYTILDDIESGDILNFSLAGDLSAAARPAVDEASNGDDDNILSNVLFGVGVVLIMLGGMYLLYEVQKSGVAATASVANNKTRDELIAEIAQLDDLYEGGELDTNTYEEKRAILKADLRQFYE